MNRRKKKKKKPNIYVPKTTAAPIAVRAVLKEIAKEFKIRNPGIYKNKDLLNLINEKRKTGHLSMRDVKRRAKKKKYAL
jgi:hypothetical protein